MTKTAQWIIDACNSEVNDDLTKWTVASHWVPFINTGQLLIADISPESTNVTVTALLAAGAVQSCPTGSLRFLSLTCNYGRTGTNAGKAITVCDSDTLSAFNPGWMGGTAGKEIEHYVFDENEPTKFRVYPPVPVGGLYVGLKHQAAPTDCVNASSSLSIPDRYAPALVEWCVYRALSAETDAADPNKAQGYLSNFFNLMGVKLQNRARYSPNVQDRAGVPPRVTQ